MPHKYENTTSVFSHTEALLSAFQALTAANDVLRSTMRAMGKQPQFLPTVGGDADDEEQRRQVINAWTALHIPRNELEPVAAGMVCVTPAVATAIEEVNVCKADFKLAVEAVRKMDLGNRHRPGDLLQPLLDQLTFITDPRTKSRGEALQQALDTTGLGSLQLKRCFKLIRVLDGPLRSLSWTWSSSNTITRHLDYNDAVKLAAALPVHEGQQFALDQLARQPSNQPLAMLKHSQPQLRANLVWRDGEGFSRDAIPISGVLAFTGAELPELLWRDKPSPEQLKQPQRMARVDRNIDRDNAVVKKLNLYRYIDPQKAVDNHNKRKEKLATA
jgi:hypothetical protein